MRVEPFEAEELEPVELAQGWRNSTISWPSAPSRRPGPAAADRERDPDPQKREVGKPYLQAACKFQGCNLLVEERSNSLQWWRPREANPRPHCGVSGRLVRLSRNARDFRLRRAVTFHRGPTYGARSRHRVGTWAVRGLWANYRRSSSTKSESRMGLAGTMGSQSSSGGASRAQTGCARMRRTHEG